MSRRVELKTGQILLEQGSDSDQVYRLEAGELEAYTLAGERESLLGRILPGEFVGELGVLQGQPRGASVRAIMPSRLAVLDRDEFLALIANKHEHCLQLMHALSLRTRLLLDLIAEVDAKTHSSRPRSISALERWWLGFFRWLAEKLRGKGLVSTDTPLAQTSGRMHIKAGQILFREGHRSPVACRLVSGKLKVFKSSGPMARKIGLVHPGEFVGEIGLLEGAPRSATVSAILRSEVEIFDQARLQQLIRQDSTVGLAIIDTLSRRATRLGKECQRIQEAYASKLDNPAKARIQDLLNSVGEAYEVTGERLERDFHTLQRGLALEAIAARGMMGTYVRYLKNEASPQQMEQANADFVNLLKSLGLGTLLVLPGSPITIPALVKAAQKFGVDILPKNRLDED